MRFALAGRCNLRLLLLDLSALDEPEDVVLGYATTNAGASDLRNVHVVFFCDAAHERRRALASVIRGLLRAAPSRCLVGGGRRSCALTVSLLLSGGSAVNGHRPFADLGYGGRRRTRFIGLANFG